MSAKGRQIARVLACTALASVAQSLAACSGDDSTGDDAGTQRDSGGGCTLDFTAAPTTFTLISTEAGSGSSTGGLQGQGLFAANQMSRGCGIDGTRTTGVLVEVVGRDAQDNASIAANFVRQASRDGRLFVVGAGGPAPTTAAAEVAVDRRFPMGIYGSSNDELRGCTEAQLLDTGVRKTSAPTAVDGECWDTGGYIFRTAITNAAWSAAATQFALVRDPSLGNASFLVREDGSGSTYAASGVTFFEGTGSGRVASSTTFPANPTDLVLRTALRSALASDPDVLFTEMTGTELRQLFEAYVALGEDSTFSKGPNFDSLLFINGSSARPDFTDLDTAVIEVLRARFLGLIPTWDATSDGFRRWSDAYRSFDPDAVITNHEQPRTYDAIMILALAALAARDDDGAAIAARIRDVANPPGQIIFPDEFDTARALLMAGEDINYEGASGPVDIDDAGEVQGGPFLVWSVAASGKDFTLELFTPSL